MRDSPIFYDRLTASLVCRLSEDFKWITSYFLTSCVRALMNITGVCINSSTSNTVDIIIRGRLIRKIFYKFKKCDLRTIEWINGKEPANWSASEFNRIVIQRIKLLVTPRVAYTSPVARYTQQSIPYRELYCSTAALRRSWNSLSPTPGHVWERNREGSGKLTLSRVDRG